MLEQQKVYFPLNQLRQYGRSSDRMPCLSVKDKTCLWRSLPWDYGGRSAKDVHHQVGANKTWMIHKRKSMSGSDCTNVRYLVRCLSICSACCGLIAVVLGTARSLSFQSSAEQGTFVWFYVGLRSANEFFKKTTRWNVFVILFNCLALSLAIYIYVTQSYQHFRR